jgi:hypothetical protein
MVYPMIERRALERINIGQLALLHVHGVCGVHPCMVKNFYDGGAKLSFAGLYIPAFEFDLSLDGFKSTKHCHMIWRDGNTCGVEFVARGQSR